MKIILVMRYSDKIRGKCLFNNQRIKVEFLFSGKIDIRNRIVLLGEGHKFSWLNDPLL